MSIYQSNVYHNLFYARSMDDLKHKKDRIAASFDIYVSEPGINVGRSYSTIIANVDINSKILLLSWSRYSRTTTRQINTIYSAMPGDFDVIYTDDLERWPSPKTIVAATEKAADDAKNFFKGLKKITQANIRDYCLHLHNLYVAIKQTKDGGRKYKKAAKIASERLDVYTAKLDAKRDLIKKANIQ